MENNKCFWGGVLGKVVAACIVLGVVFGAVALSLLYTKHADVLLDVTEVDITDSDYDEESGTLVLYVKSKKSGYCISDVKTYEKETGTGKNIKTKLMVKFYGSLSHGDYTPDEDGVYTLKIKIENDDIYTVVQEGKEHNNGTIANLHS